MSRENIIDQESFNKALIEKRKIDITQVRRCLSNGAIDVDYEISGKGTALHYSVRANNVELVRLLRRFKADSRIIDKIGQIPFHIAAINNNTELMGITAIGDCNLKDKFNRTALDWALDLGNKEAVDHLVILGAEVNYDFVNSFFKNGRFDVVSIIYDINSTVSYFTINIVEAAKKLIEGELFEDKVQILCLMLENGLDVNERSDDGVSFKDKLEDEKRLVEVELETARIGYENDIVNKKTKDLGILDKLFLVIENGYEMVVEEKMAQIFAKGEEVSVSSELSAD